jgi:hypothetical protein
MAEKRAVPVPLETLTAVNAGGLYLDLTGICLRTSQLDRDRLAARWP